MTDILVKSAIKGVVYALIAAVTVCALVMYCGIGTGRFPEIPTDKYQAVFLEGGQVYFGHMKDVGGDYVTLSNVYYLKEASELSQSNLNLVKLGGELHGPEDTIHIRKDAISFWENMKDTSRVVQSIADSQ